MKSGAWHLLATLERRLDAMTTTCERAHDGSHPASSELGHVRRSLHRALLDPARHDADLIDLYLHLDARLQRLAVPVARRSVTTLQPA